MNYLAATPGDAIAMGQANFTADHCGRQSMCTTLPRTAFLTQRVVVVGGAMLLYNEPQTSVGCIASPSSAWLVAAHGAPLPSGASSAGTMLLTPPPDWAVAPPKATYAPNRHAMPSDGACVYRLVPQQEPPLRQPAAPSDAFYVAPCPSVQPERAIYGSLAHVSGEDTNAVYYTTNATAAVLPAPAVGPLAPAATCRYQHDDIGAHVSFVNVASVPTSIHSNGVSTADASTLLFDDRPSNAACFLPTPPTAEPSYRGCAASRASSTTSGHGPHHHHHQDPVGAPTGQTRPPADDQSNYGDDNFTPTNAVQPLTPSQAWLAAAPVAVARRAGHLRTPSSLSAIDGAVDDASANNSPTPSVLVVAPAQRPKPTTVTQRDPRGARQRSVAPSTAAACPKNRESHQPLHCPQLGVGLTMIDALFRERDDDGVARRIDALTSPGQLDVLVAALEASPKVVYDLCVNDRGRIISGVIRRVGAAACPVAFSVVCMFFEEIATSKFGCFAIPAIAKELTEPQAAKLFSYCVPLSPQLIAHPYGNFVVSYIMSCGCDSFVAHLCAKIGEDPSNVHRAAVDRHGTYTIETILKNGSAAALRPLFDALFLHSDQSLLDLCSHERGSYAIESAINAMQRVKKDTLPCSTTCRRESPSTSHLMSPREENGRSAPIDCGRYVDAAHRVLGQTRFARYINRSLKKLGLA